MKKKAINLFMLTIISLSLIFNFGGMLRAEGTTAEVTDLQQIENVIMEETGQKLEQSLIEDKLEEEIKATTSAETIEVIMPEIKTEEIFVNTLEETNLYGYVWEEEFDSSTMTMVSHLYKISIPDGSKTLIKSYSEFDGYEVNFTHGMYSSEVIGDKLYMTNHTEVKETGYQKALYVVDTVTGDIARIANITGTGTDERLHSMTYDPITKKAFLLTDYAIGHDEQVTALYTLDLTTGEATKVAEISEDNLITIAFNSKGELYGIGSVNIDGNDNLYLVNKTTGELTLIGATGLDLESFCEMKFDKSTDQLYGVIPDYEDEQIGLYQIDTTTGLATLLKDLGDETWPLTFALPEGSTAESSGQYANSAILPQTGQNTIMILGMGIMLLGTGVILIFKKLNKN
ncbi:MAG: LPXTG cell wall anchor domain-containing protein [Fusobacteria bacterium]|nr:LPXTG cell wall anchor domain-containing protein [Fusobacteriota bacterium]